MGTAVYLDRPPRSAFLVSWGRAPHTWWGCVKFRVSVEASGHRSELAAAAWVPASSVTRPTWSSKVDDIPRLELGDEQAEWPPPTGWPYWYAGVWANGPLVLPDGVTLVTGPRWSKR